MASVNSVRSGSVLAVVIAVTAVLPSFGQVPVSQSGTARDANNRVGSGGINSRSQNYNQYTPNDVALGRVTGGRDFRGNLTGDPTQPFGGRSNLPSDRILRQGNPSVTPAAPNLPAGTYAVPFYSGTSPTTSTPSNFVLNSYTGQYVYQPPVMVGSEDIQFGAAPGTAVIRPGAGGEQQLILPTVMQDNNGRSAIVQMTATPLLGVRPLPGLSDELQYLMNRSGDRLRASEAPLDPLVLRELRAEMRRARLTDAQLAEQIREARAQSQAMDASLPGALPAARVDSQPLDARPAQAAQIVPGAVNPQLSGIPAVTRPDPAERNPLLRELRRLEAERLEAREKAGKLNAAPSSPAPRAVPGESDQRPASRPTLPTDTGAPVAPGAVVPTVRPASSIPVDALSDRLSNEGVKKLAKSAEDLMSKGRFASAVDRFEAVRKFTPGDATVLVARMHAELGGGFFARAETSLRQAVATDAAVLNARYDLAKEIGEKRLDGIVDDLKKLAVDNKDESMPVLLLSYIAYHRGDTARAAALLDEARQRKPADTLPAELKSRWVVEETK